MTPGMSLATMQPSAKPEENLADVEIPEGEPPMLLVSPRPSYYNWDMPQNANEVFAPNRLLHDYGYLAPNCLFD